MLRIIAGKAKGTQIDVPEGLGVRPTLDKVKGAIFSALGTMENAVVLDLFAGSGNLGLEALSRGADEVILIEKVPTFYQLILTNIEKVKKSIAGWKNSEPVVIKAINANGLAAPQILSQRQGEFNLILADPPYIPNEDQKGPLDVLNSIELAEFVAEDAILALESGPEIFSQIGEDIPWQLIKKKNYGRNTAVSFWRLKGELK